MPGINYRGSHNEQHRTNSLSTTFKTKNIKPLNWWSIEVIDSSSSKGNGIRRHHEDF